MKKNRLALVLLVLVAVLGLVLQSCGGGGGGGGGLLPISGGTGGTDLVVTAFTSPSSATAGGNFTVTGTVTNRGGALAAGASVIIFLSPFSDVTIDGGQAGLDVYAAVLNPGQSWNFSILVGLPSSMPNGNYYLGALAVTGAEANTTNNMWSRPISVTGGTTCTSDGYEPDNSSGASRTISLGESQQHNHCEATSDWLRFSATAGKTYGVTTDQIGDNAWTMLELYGTDGKTKLATGATVTWEFGASRLSWTAPSNGTYYLRVLPVATFISAGPGSDYRVTLGDQRPDLVIESIWSSESGFPGGITTMGNSVRNQGFAAAGASFDVSVYLSADSTVTTGDRLLGTRTVGSLAVSELNNNSSLSYNLPAELTPGTYYIAAIADAGSAVDEYAETNNVSAVQTITVLALPGCSADAYESDGPDYTTAGLITVGELQSRNHCDDGVDWLKFSAVSGEWYAIRVQQSGLSDAWMQLYGQDGTTVLNGSSGTTAIDWQAPASGTYYLKVEGSIGSGRDYTVQVQQLLPDLTQSLWLQGVTTAVAGGFLTIADQVSNQGFADAGPFEVGIYLASSSTVTTSDTLVGGRQLSGLVKPGYSSATDSAWYEIAFPKELAPGTYYLAAVADKGGAVQEVSEANNVSASVSVTVTAPPCAWDAYEDDDTSVAAKAISSGETQSRTTIWTGSSLRRRQTEFMSPMQLQACLVCTSQTGPP